MNAITTCPGHRSGIFGNRKGVRFVLTSLFLMVFAGSLFAGSVPLTHMPGKPAHTGFHAIPGRPDAGTLSHFAPRPDLAVGNIRFADRGKGRVDTIITIKNVGRASSPAARVTAVLVRGNGTRAKQGWSVKPLRVNEAFRIVWRIRTMPGKNTVRVVISDPQNPRNNSLEKTYAVLAPPARSLARHEATKTEGARRAPALERNKAEGVLAVQEVTFDDHRAKRPDVSWVVIRVKNIGRAPTPAASLKLEIQRADGTRTGETLKVKPLMPREAVRIARALRMARGLNTLRIVGIGKPGQPSAMTFRNPSQPFVTRHIFNPRIAGVGHASPAALAKNAARASGKRPGENLPNANTLRALSKTRPVPPPKPAETTTYDAQVSHFIAPQRNEVISPNTPFTIRWVMPEPEGGTHLELHLKSATNPKQFPELILARHLSASTRRYTWDVGPIPPGHLYTLSLLSKTSASDLHTVTSVDVKIDAPHFGIFRMTAVPNKPYVNRKITLFADVVNAGGDISTPFYSKVRVTGPDSFILESRRIETAALRHGKPARISFSFTPPIPGTYTAVYDLDVTHAYTSPSGDTPEITRTFNFDVHRLPDLVVLINKVPDGTLAIDRIHFHIKVINVGDVPSPPTKVYFDLTDQERKVYDVPSLLPITMHGYGTNSWSHDFSKRWQTYSGGTGEKTYSVVVDPGNRIQEVDETNNRIDDRFHIYRAGQPRPKHAAVPPSLQVIGVYGLPTAPVPLGSTLSYLIRLKCVSPDRTPIYPIFSIILDHTCYETYEPYRWIYPGQTIDIESSSRTSKMIRIDIPGTHTFRVKCSSSRESWGETIFERGIVVRESGENTRNLQEVLANKTRFLPRGGEDKHPITVLSPAKNKIWATGRTYQIAWTGEATGPFTVLLDSWDNPGVPTRISESVSGYAIRYTPGQDLPPGLYRVKVQSADGWGISDVFTITHDAKPNLKFKAVSISSRLSGDPKNPYLIEVPFILENTGGYESTSFNVLLTVTREGVPQLQGGILMDAMLDRHTATGRIRIKVPEGGNYTVKLVADARSNVDETNENDNSFINPRYRIKPYPDLRVACFQAGRKLHFTVKNTGDGTSRATVIYLRFKRPGNPPASLYPTWRREGDTILVPPIPVKALGAGKMLEKDVYFPADYLNGITYTATVNPRRKVRELCYDNNFVVGTLSAASLARIPDDWWKTAFGVEDRSQHDVAITGTDTRDHSTVRAALRFVIWNKSDILVTPADPPTQAILHVTQGGRDKTCTYDLPPLFSVTRASRRDEFRIRREVLLMASQGDVSYTLFLKKGNEMKLLVSGKVTIGGESGGGS